MKVKVGAWIGGLILFIGILFLGVSLFMKLESSIPLILAVLLLVILLISALIATVNEKKQKFCKVCKRQFDFDDEIEYSEIGRYTRTYKYDLSKSTRQKTESLTYKVAFTCTCKSCGNQKSYVKKIYGGAAYSDGSIDIKDPEDVIEKYFKYDGLSVNDKKTVVTSVCLGILSIILSIITAFADFSGITSYFGPSLKDKLSAEPYYGTYYGVTENFAEYKLIISDRRVEVYSKELLGNGGVRTYDDGEQVFYTAEYMQENFADSNFSDCPALVLDSQYIFWITNMEDGAIEFTIKMQRGDYLTLTPEEKNLDIVTSNPKNYYGIYSYDVNNSIKINKGSTCTISLQGNSGNGTWSYFYANQEVLKLFNIQGYNKGIIAYQGDSYIWFVFDGEDLLMNGEHRFKKSN